MISIEELQYYTSNLSLLYVEDDEMIQERNHEIFIDFFHTVDLAGNGDEGLIKYQQHHKNTNNFYDVVITDIRMPKMSGITMSQLIKEKCIDQIIIVLSAHKDAEYLFELINMGITYFLPKPTSIETLYEMLLKTSKIVYNRNMADKYSEKLILLNRELELNVLELQQSKQKAEEATKLKDRFLANMSHEVRTPMNAIMGLSHILLRSSLKEKERQNVLKIENSAKVLLQIINDILDFSKIEAGKLYLESIEFNLNSVIKYVSTIIDVKAMSKNIEIIYNISDDVPQLLIGDPIRLGQILLNLIDNAVKFTHQGNVILHVNCIYTHNNHCLLQFDVIDDGIGIAKEKINTLFNAFIQADNSTTREYGGSGLGLSITKHLVQMMDGEINVTSSKGEGSTFSFAVNLPYLDKKCSQDVNIDSKKERLISGIQLQNKIILLVEDNEVNRHVITSFLENSKAKVITALNGLEAVTAAKNRNIDLILMDINIPIIDGYEATQHIRNNLNTVPIIGLSANAIQKDIDNAINVGMNDYIQKPLDVQFFYKILVQYIDGATLIYTDADPLSVISTHPFEAIEGLDAIDALERMEHKVELYEKVVIGFFKMFENSAQHLKVYLLDEDYDSAYRLCHDIQGSSGNISATKLYAITKKMQDAISSHKQDNALKQVESYAQTFLELAKSVSKHHKLINTEGTP